MTTTSLPLVLLPGFMCDARLWHAVEPALATQGPLLLCGPLEGDSIEAMALHVLPQLPEQCHLIAFSMGGYVARHLATIAPERVRSLSLLNTSARASSVEEVQRNQQQIRMLQTFPYRGQTRAALQRAVHPAHPEREALLDLLQSMSLDLGVERFRQQLSVIRADGHAELAALRCPLLLVASHDDQMRSLQETRNMQAAAPHAVCHILDDCGHMSVLEQAERVSQLLLDFLSP
ncbi:alpha/beta fold hydrolase [Undibacterium rugosum]|uniref:alpha/beta fold hydrolase n=1 Tax=Undibacterium rugosum TaxID=2762291 RepID=UPI001B80FE12|nr:alpha/beta fold hydrolase [Undibacterium rugosum]MBR7779606.1 alpha/beta fold hydrolase [Undibacterium rugosum]